MHGTGQHWDTNSQRKIRVFLADSHRIVRESLRVLLQAQSGFGVVGQAGDPAEAMKLVAELKPDVLVLDLQLWTYSLLGEMWGSSNSPTPVRTIVLAAASDTLHVADAFARGVRGVVLMESPPQALIESIYSVMEGRYWAVHESRAKLPKFRGEFPGAFGKDNRYNKHFGLTPRELEIVKLIAAAYKNRDIAEKFSICERTVKTHIANIFTKIGVSNRLDLALFACRCHLADEA